MTIKASEKSAILQSLAAGVVPKVGLQHIQVGRKRELEALIADLKSIEGGSAAVRFVIGPFGSGKTFFLNLVRTVALQRRFVVLQADLTLDRRLYSTGGHARALYTELIQNMSTKAKPDGGGMPGLVERFVSDVYSELGDKPDADTVEKEIRHRLQPVLDMTNGASFVRVLARYVEGYVKQDDYLTNSAVRWLRAEYSTKTEARADLNVRDIVNDADLYDMIRLWAEFVRLIGYKGLFVNVDEMVVLSERLNNAGSRVKNYEVVLQILNACLQGGVKGLGYCFAGTDEFLSDRRRGLFSYEALSTRLAENRFASSGLVDMRGPVIRLEPLTREDLFVLLQNITRVHARGGAKPLLNDNGLRRFLNYCENKLGAQYFLTPRDTVKQFVGLLNVLEQNPESNLESLLAVDLPANDNEPGIDRGSDDTDNDLRTLRL